MGSHPDERLDVVDDENLVVGQATRQEVHDQGYLHRSAHLVLVSPNRHFLLQQRAESRPTHPGRWDASAAGHVLAGSDFGETVLREAREEIGFNAEGAVPLLLLEGSPETEYEWVQFYVEEVTTEPKLSLDSSEVKQLRWWPEDELVRTLVEQPNLFTPVFPILFFLWRQTEFLIPTRQQDGWYAISHADTDRLHVQRALLESAGLRARAGGDFSWIDPREGRPLFSSHRKAPNAGLRVPLEDLPEAVALLYLSQPMEE